jgi:hypothetical protein
VSIVGQTHTYTRPVLYQKQESAIFCDERYGLIEASTKSGKTVGCIVWLTEQALRGKLGQNFWWIAPIREQSKISFKRLRMFMPRELYTTNLAELTITLSNGAVIWFKGADNPDSLYGEDVYAAVIDEATRCKEDAWFAVRSTLTATDGPIRIIGNVKGRKNWAYRMARRAESGEQGMHYARITAHDAVDAKVITQQEIEDAQRQLPASVFRELYLAEPSDDAANPFGADAINRCVKPLSGEAPVAWGIDLAKSTDWTVCIAVDAKGAVCSFERWQGPWEDTIARIMGLTEHLPSLVDSTGVGDPVLESLQKRGREQGARYEGFKFSASTKQQIMEGLAVAIQQQHITYPQGVISNELLSFEFEYTRAGVRYTAPPGLHDDCVCALALAVESSRRFTNKDWRLLEFDKPSSQTEKRLNALRQKRASTTVSNALKSDGVYWPEV